MNLVVVIAHCSANAENMPGIDTEDIDADEGRAHLIVGGTGFIGRHVAVALARAQRKVIVASRSEPKFVFPSDVAARIEWRHFDCANADWEDLLTNVRVVHYYAWTSTPAIAQGGPGNDLISNVLPVVRFLESLKALGKSDTRLIFASSGGTVYGNPDTIPIAETHKLQPSTAYGSGKVAAETYLNLYRLLYGLDCRIARIGNPYGAGQNLEGAQGVATLFAAKALKGDQLVVWGSGNTVRDFIHISDLTDGLIRFASLEPKAAAPTTVNLANGKGISVNEIITELTQQVSHRLDVSYQTERIFDVPANVLDISLAGDALNWYPRLSFRQGIARTLSDLATGSSFSELG